MVHGCIRAQRHLVADKPASTSMSISCASLFHAAIIFLCILGTIDQWHSARKVANNVSCCYLSRSTYNLFGSNFGLIPAASSVY
ncbi:hypothetical protein DAI22_01g169300 [Oryza sativa Japonica Group]|nr:hypothetical protein DAI22_01g169300 [Oryza sativa Japonica Group]